MKNLKFFFVTSFMLAFLGVEAQTNWSTTGNAGTNPSGVTDPAIAPNFIGTLESRPLIFKIGIGGNTTAFAGMISSSGVTSFGLNSCRLTHNQSTAFGENALRNNAYPGTYNTAFGFSTLEKNTSGGYNVAVGHKALYGNISGSLNTAVGYEALTLNLVSGNNAFGLRALANKTNGNSNVAVGNNASYNNTEGSNNVSVGNNSGGGWNTPLSSVSGNTCIGTGAGFVITTGADYNTFLGNDSGKTVTTGNKNICIGNNSGYALMSGSGNTIIGVSNVSPTLMNTVIIGNGAGLTHMVMKDRMVGIGVKFDVSIGSLPSNTLELDSGTNGQSGLTFSKLTTANTPVVTTFDGVLSVDATGKVILVKDKVGTGGSGLINNCGSNNFITKTNATGNLGCSSIYDDGANHIGFLYGATPLTAVNVSVNGTLATTGIFNTSDRKFKKDIKIIENPLEKILSLEGKTYNWRKDEFKNINFTDELQYGLIAQEVQKVLPSLVLQSENGDLAMNYTGLIPVLIEGMKAQQSQIVTLNNRIEDLLSKGILEENKITDGKTYFSSNYPNPFETSTKIDYFIHTSVKEAQIIVYDFNGTTISKYELKERNTPANTVINKGNLKAGTYFYTLITDGAVIGTKKMIVK